MSRLRDCLLRLSQDLTVDEFADAAGLARTTAGRWLKALRDDGDLSAWSAPALEALAAFESRRWGSTAISDALRPAPAGAAAAVSADPVAQAQRAQHQMLVAGRRNGSLALRLSAAVERRTVDRTEAREMLQKAEAAMEETAKQMAQMQSLRDSLLAKLKSGA
jgi:hypothetical protein